MIEWNDSTQLKTKKMPRPLMPSSCWFASLDNTNQWDSQASESSTQKEKKKEARPIFLFHIIIVKEHWQSTVFPTFSITFSNRKKNS